MTPRREFSAATRRAAWERCGGFCEAMIEVSLVHHFGKRPGYRLCNAPLDHGNFHYDHIDPDWFSKDNELENCQVLCRECHKDKTARDRRNIDKSKRIQDKRIKARKPKGRPMPGTKRSGIRKRLDGTVERR